MYRLLIVDDEPHTRQQIRNAVNWALMDVEIAGEAANGLQALELSEKLKPHIAIADIKMPCMDGISFAMEFSRRFPSSQLIFLSGYSDRDYMRNAIRLKAVDYIFKPFELPDLLSAVEKAIQHLNAASCQAPLDEELALKLLYQSSQPSFEDYVRSLSLPIALTAAYIVVFIRLDTSISFSHYDSKSPCDSMELQNLVNCNYQSYLAESKNLFGDSFLLSKGGSSYCLLANLPPSLPVSDVSKELLSSFLYTTAGAAPAIGVSPVYASASCLNHAFCQARNAAQAAFMAGYGKILSVAHIPSRQFVSGHTARDSYCENLEKENIPEAMAALDHYFTYLQSCSPDYIPSIREELLQISLQLNQKLEEAPFRLISEFISQASTLEDIRQYILHLLHLYLAQIESRDSHSRIVLEAERYIIDHLGESLPVKQIADQVYVSPTYLCFLYKRQTGHTLKQFIQKMRMKKAGSLLLETDLKIGDIASSLGYVNQNYFTKNFVAYYGTTPSRFRNRKSAAEAIYPR